MSRAAKPIGHPPQPWRIEGWDAQQTGKNRLIKPNVRADGRPGGELNTGVPVDDSKVDTVTRVGLMQIPCPFCQTKVELDHRHAGQTLRCVACGKSFVAPAELSQTGRRHSLTEFPVLAVVALNCVTGGLFALIHLNMMHDRMPRLRPDDPSGLKALGLCFVPIVNIYWVFFTFHRLCLRINEQRRFHGLTDSAPGGVALAVALLTACALATPWIHTTGIVVLGVLGFVLLPIFAAMVQRAVNELIDTCQTPAAAI
ncbi:MAG: hypothetical protein IID37_14055 [Planctomycetes bacterium]|nr:hypothetical protein [Planctomycetota bacterium]